MFHVSFALTVAAELTTSVEDSLCGLFPRLPRGQTLGIFLLCHSHFPFVSNKDTIAGRGFSTEPDMSCVYFE